MAETALEHVIVVSYADYPSFNAHSTGAYPVNFNRESKGLCHQIRKKTACPKEEDDGVVPDRNRKRALAALLGTVLIWSSTYVSTKQALTQVPPLTLAFMRFALASLVLLPVTATLATTVYGMIFLLPFVVVEVWGFAPHLSLLTIANVLYLGVVASALPIFLWNYALKYYDAFEAGLYTNLVPVVSVMSAVALLGERVSTGQLLAGGVVILGVVLASSGGFRRNRQPFRMERG